MDRRPATPLPATACSAFVLALAVLMACENEGASPSSGSASSGGPDASLAADGSDAEASSSSGSSGAVENPPPGCTDGGPTFRVVILDATRIRITSLSGTTAELCNGGGERQTCAFELLDALLTVPDTSKSGSWALPHPDV